MAENTIDTLNINVKADVNDALKGINKIHEALNKLEKFAGKLGLDKLKIKIDGIGELKKATDELGKTQEKLKDIDDISKEYSNFSTGLKEVSETIQKASKSYNSLSEMIARLNKTSEATQNTSKNDNIFSKVIEKLKGVSAGLKEVSETTQNTSKSYNSFSNMIGRSLVFTAMYRAIHLVTEGLKEGVQNLYQYSKALNGTFANSLDRITSSFLYLKNSVGAAVAPLVNAVTPAIEWITDKVVNLFNLVNQLIAKLTGASSWTRAVKVQQEYAESTEAAAEAVQNLLVGFDELNILGSQSAGSSALNTTDYSSMFEEVPIEDINPIVKTISESIQTVWDAIQKVWDKLKDLKEWMNGVFGEELSDVLTVVGSIAAAFAAWKITSSFLSDLFDVHSKLDALKVAAELTISIVGYSMEYNAIKNIASGSNELSDYVSAIIGASLGIAGLTMALGPTGFIVGIGLTLLIAAKATMDASNEKYFQSELHEKLSELVEKAEEDMEIAANLKLRVDSIGINVDEVEQTFAELKDLVNQAFDINDIPLENRTSEEAAKLENLVKSINDMGIIEIHFDDGYIVETREQVQGLIDDQYEYYMTVALQEAIIEAYKAQAEAVYDLENAQEDAITITDEYETAQRRLDLQLTSLDRALLGVSDTSEITSEKMNSFGGKLVQVFSGAQDAVVKVAEKFGIQTDLVVEDMKTQVNALEEAETAYNGVQQAIDDDTTAFNEASDKADYFTERLAEITSATNNVSTSTEDVSNKYSNLDDVAQNTIGQIKTQFDILGDRTKNYISNELGSLETGLTNIGNTATDISNDDYKLNFTTTVDLDGLYAAEDEVSKLHEKIQEVGRAKQDKIMSAAGIPGFASGGFPDEGQLFIAREAGSPELVGSINGHTAVANNNDIVAGIAQGVMEANTGTEALLRALIKAVETQGGGSTTVTISTNDIVSALNRKNRRDGKTVVPVGV